MLRKTENNFRLNDNATSLWTYGPFAGSVNAAGTLCSNHEVPKQIIAFQELNLLPGNYTLTKLRAPLYSTSTVDEVYWSLYIFANNTFTKIAETKVYGSGSTWTGTMPTTVDQLGFANLDGSFAFTIPEGQNIYWCLRLIGNTTTRYNYPSMYRLANGTDDQLSSYYKILEIDDDAASATADSCTISKTLNASFQFTTTKKKVFSKAVGSEQSVLIPGCLDEYTWTHYHFKHVNIGGIDLQLYCQGNSGQASKHTWIGYDFWEGSDHAIGFGLDDQSYNGIFINSSDDFGNIVFVYNKTTNKSDLLYEQLNIVDNNFKWKSSMGWNAGGYLDLSTHSPAAVPTWYRTPEIDAGTINLLEIGIDPILIFGSTEECGDHPYAYEEEGNIEVETPAMLLPSYIDYGDRIIYHGYIEANYLTFDDATTSGFTRYREAWGHGALIGLQGATVLWCAYGTNDIGLMSGSVANDFINLFIRRFVGILYESMSTGQNTMIILPIYNPNWDSEQVKNWQFICSIMQSISNAFGFPCYDPKKVTSHELIGANATRAFESGYSKTVKSDGQQGAICLV